MLHEPDSPRKCCLASGKDMASASPWSSPSELVLHLLIGARFCSIDRGPRPHRTCTLSSARINPCPIRDGSQRGAVTKRKGSDYRWR